MLITKHIAKALQLSRRTSACRLFSTSPVSSSSTSDQSQNIGFSRDGSTIICWHPEPDYPYEHSKPLPRSLPELQEADTSALKVQVKQDYVTRFSKDGPTDRELTQMFSTTKHTWYPKAQARNKWYRRKFEKDREAL